MLTTPLGKIDRLSFPGKLPENPDTDQWVHKWTNLKHIYDALSIFLTEEYGQRLPLAGGRRPDLKAIAQSSSLADTILLLKLLVVAAINCSERVEFLQQMQELAESTQEVLMATAQEAGEDDEDSPSGFDHVEVRATEPVRAEVDSELASEERLGKVIADNQRIAHEKRELQKELDESFSRVQKLQERYDQVQDELKEANDRLAAVLAGRSESGANRPLDSKHETIIAALETRASEAENENGELRKSNEILKIKAEKAQKLQDDYDEIKIERDRLARKANAAEKYKQKLEASQDLEKENLNLRTKINELQLQLKQSDATRVSTSDLQREIDEYRRLLPSIEQERYEVNEMKKRLELDYHALEARYHDTAEQLSRQQHTVEDLQGRLRDYEDGITPAPREPDNVKDLESEEGEFAESEARLTAALVNGEMESENNGISEDELKAIMAAMRAQAQAGTASERETGLRAQKKLLIAVERARAKNKQLLEHVQKQSTLINALQSQQSKEMASTSQDTASATPVEPPPVSGAEPAPAGSRPHSPDSESKLDEALRLNENLRRELRLMMSAWYEQSLRLASSSGSATTRLHAVPEPRSFLGKQRKVVNALTFGTSVS